MNLATLLLGCNIGSCESTFIETLSSFEKKCGKIILQSSLYRTEPWGFSDQSDFLNQVVIIETFLTPLELLNETREIESELGRSRMIINGPRIIDIDILFYNDLEVITNDLIIPHPRLHLRKFTLIPLNEITPDYTHPSLKKTIAELLVECDDELNVFKKEK
ncbi:MAG: 2-amino-4-hydroxy-6-hydroxymethyldihydropteridine diphosphokinase [Bacteroidota bacterium]|jgi:2-amino-4-hydroxy-6-hydroxymethyldihydropteridine diphosphokinase